MIGAAERGPKCNPRITCLGQQESKRESSETWRQMNIVLYCILCLYCIVLYSLLVSPIIRSRPLKGSLARGTQSHKQPSAPKRAEGREVLPLSPDSI